MGARFFITIRSDLFSDEILLETQGDLPLSELLLDILKILNWPIEIDGKKVAYILRTDEKELIQSSTLISAGIINFETVWISPVEHKTSEKKKVKSLNNTQSTPSFQEPYWVMMPVEQPSLIHPDGFIFVLDQLPILIGRKGGEKPIQIDLAEFEKDKFISSRCHAEIVLDKGKYCLHAFKTRNGTFIGRDELQPGEKRPLINNDIIQFGIGGVRLIFREPLSG